MMLLKEANMCAWPTGSTLTTRFLALRAPLFVFAIVLKGFSSDQAVRLHQLQIIHLLFGCFLFVRNGLLFTLTRARIILGLLATQR